MKAASVVMTALWIAFLAGIAAAGIKYVAVVETEIDVHSGASAQLNSADVRQVTSALRREAVRNLPSGKYNIMTSETVYSQGSATLEACAEENCVITLGAKIGADYIVRGIISKLRAKFTLSVEIYETEDGNLVASSDLVSSDNIEDLVKEAAVACANMYRTFENTQGSAKISTQKSESNAVVQKPKASLPIIRPTASANNEPRLTDSRDGKTYRTVMIGAKRWMAENINYQTNNSWCYGDNNSNCGIYGRLYEWNTATTVCPAGWRLPSRQEWKDLIDAVGDKKGQGKKLKAKKPIWNGNDAYGFSAMPGGIRETDGHFYNVDHYGYWWTSTEDGGRNAYYRNMFYNVADVLEGLNDKGSGFSVRCVQE